MQPHRFPNRIRYISIIIYGYMTEIFAILIGIFINFDVALRMVRVSKVGFFSDSEWRDVWFGWYCLVFASLVAATISEKWILEH